MPSAGAIKSARAYVELFADDSKLVRGLKRAQAKLKAFAASIKQFGQKLLAVSSLAAVPLAISAKTFANFESQMARVQALSGSTGEQFSRLENKAKRLGATTVFSASQAAEAMSSFVLAGFDVEQILSAIGPTLDLAAAGQIEIAEAADIAAKIMAGMGLSASELGDAVDVMAKAMTTANTDLEHFLNWFSGTRTSKQSETRHQSVHASAQERATCSNHAGGRVQVRRPDGQVGRDLSGRDYRSDSAALECRYSGRNGRLDTAGDSALLNPSSPVWGRF